MSFGRHSTKIGNLVRIPCKQIEETLQGNGFLEPKEARLPLWGGRFALSPDFALL